MSYIDASEVVRKAVVTTIKGLGYTVNGNAFPRVEVMSVTGQFGLDKDNETEIVTVQLDVITQETSPAHAILMRKNIVEKFCLIGLDGMVGLISVYCALDMDEDIHEIDDVNEIYRRILRFEILTHK
jgi:hypothetical protein